MSNIISGILYQDGTVFAGSGFTCKLDTIHGDDMYVLEFPDFKTVPSVISQAWEIDDAITCLNVGYKLNPTIVMIRTVDKDGEFVKNGFTFVAVSND